MTPGLGEIGYRAICGFVDRRLAGILYQLLLLRQWRGEWKRDDQVLDAASHWGDSTLDALLLGFQPDIEEIAGCALLPTYAYARLYATGNALARHRDRASCEIAVTIHLGHTGAAPPPIRFAPDAAVAQAPGDAVVYLGDQLEHWRERFTGESFGQLFLNYVRAAGDRRDRVFDGRSAAFPPGAGAR